MTKRISILLADDHAMLRGALGRRLNAEPDIAVVSSVGRAEDAVSEALRLKPQVVVMDIDMPGLSCFEAARTIQANCPDVRVVFLSAFYNDRYIEQALAIRAWGYITKTEPEDTVIQAIRKVVAGVTYFSPQVQARLVIDRYAPRLGQPVSARTSTLTEREMEILRYLARGMDKKGIARTLHISVHTVHRHATTLMDKLDIHDRVELARFAIREGLAEA